MRPSLSRVHPHRPVTAYDRVCNDECTFSFDTPFSPDGLYVSLTSHQAFGKPHVGLDAERTGNKLYVHVKHTRVEKPPAPGAEAAAPTKLGIGVAETRYHGFVAGSQMLLRSHLAVVFASF